jgi:hypothetical protein
MTQELVRRSETGTQAERSEDEDPGGAGKDKARAA